jgi:hypothetical protein
MASSGLGAVKQEFCLCLVTGLAVAGQEEDCSSTLSHDNNGWHLMVGLLKNTANYSYCHTDIHV